MGRTLADVHRLPVLGVLAGLMVLGAALAGTKAAGTSGPPGPPPDVSDAPGVALSSSWFCAGATAVPGSVAPGQLVFTNAGAAAVKGSVLLVSQAGFEKSLAVSVPAGATTTLPEQLLGVPLTYTGQWVGAIVTLYGGMAGVEQVVRTKEGSASQPCASAAAPQWYFAAGTTVLNAREEISLLNPYPVDAIADFSFSTDRGLEQPLAYQGVVVPARGLAVVNLGNHLRRRNHIALTVQARTGRIVAFETEVVTPPPAGAPPLGTPGALNAVVPVAGTSLTLGGTLASASWWWPEGADGPGLSETYDIYNPGPKLARLELTLVSPNGGGLGSSDQLAVGPFGTATVSTNGQPWALPGISYATHLESTNGVAVVAERAVAVASPSPYRGLGALLGQAQPASEWLLPPDRPVAAHRSLSQTWLEVADPGSAPAVVSVERPSGGGLAEAPGSQDFQVSAGQRAGMELPALLAGEPLVVSSSAPILVEEDSYSLLPKIGINLSPAVVLGPPAGPAA